MRWMLIGVTAVTTIGGMAWAQRERLPAECRQEIVQLCRGAQGGFRQCMRSALPKLSDPCRKAIGAREMTPIPGGTEQAFGPDPKQRLDLVKPDRAGKAPVLMFVHGGGWSIGDKRHAATDKARWANDEGWAFVTANYRLVPQATVEQQAADVASALAWVRANAAKEGLDPDRIVLMGHSAGAHLVALVGTDLQYLRTAGVPLDSVKGVILLDGAGYDIAPQANSPLNPVKPMYDAAFGKDPKRQAALSPTHHAAAPNVGSWLILPVATRPDSLKQSNELAAGLKTAGAIASVVPVPNATHMTLNRELGSDGNFATGQIEQFLAAAR